MVWRSKEIGAAPALEVASEYAPTPAPTLSSSNILSKGTPQIATPPETTCCQYLSSLATALDRAVRLPKLILQCGTAISSQMSANTRMLRTRNNLILLGLTVMAMNSFCAAAVEIPDYVLRENLYGPKLDNNLFGNEFGSVPGLVYGDRKEPYTDKIWAYNDRCNEMFEETSRRFSKAKDLATVNYYPTTLDFQQFRNHDLIPENKKLYSFGNRLRNGHPAPGFNNEGQQVMHGSCEFSTPEGGTWTSERIGPFYSTGGYDWWQLGWADIFGLKEKP